jgi:hypothetical protein
VTRTRAEEYRRLARECLALARTLSLETARAALIDRAQGWLRLAEEQEHADASINLPPPRAVEDLPVVQQQQQVQPKDDDKKD